MHRPAGTAKLVAALQAPSCVLRAKVPEPPVFEGLRESGDIVKAPIVQVLRDDWRTVLRGIGLRIAETAGYAVAVTDPIS